MVFQPSLLTRGGPGESNLLPVTIRDARICNFVTNEFQSYHNTLKLINSCGSVAQQSKFIRSYEFVLVEGTLDAISSQLPLRP